MDNYQIIKRIAHIETCLETKFGVPRQSGVARIRGRIVFEKEYRVREAFRGLEEFSHIWLLWDFSEAHRADWSPTVRPPRLGGNKRMGVFATRSPFRPNNIGLSSVRLVAVDYDCADAPVLIVEGADLMNGTPIYDVKPYLAYTDSHPEATGGFVDASGDDVFRLEVIIPDEIKKRLTESELDALTDVLSNDPRPHYQSDSERIYSMLFAGIDVRFRVHDGVVEVLNN